MESANNQTRIPVKASRYGMIRLLYDCAELVFAIRERLGHTNAGQTIEWLLNEVKTVVNAILESDSTPPPQEKCHSLSKKWNEQYNDLFLGSKSAVDAVLRSCSPLPFTKFQAYYSMASPMVSFPPAINPDVNPNFVHPEGFDAEPEDEIAK
ncbi:hypothetical protein M9H77_28562 [Catharanthus roseus]|uniref:Uncharacterized protein n=1 Tax=Catharanthus roseus TaxID=4058 RepID=A0ACC0AG26_CATRO|nr:hypothetical protein M9H77_28562 [Catharanthus roseus]